MQGAIFETWVASEILKARVHRGLPPSLSFFRDPKGTEVDLVVEDAALSSDLEPEAQDGSKTPVSP